MSHEHPVWQLLDKLQMDHRDMGARITELRAQVAALELALPSVHSCECGLSFRSPLKLAEHRYVSHDGPEPSHWLESEQFAAEPADESDKSTTTREAA